MVSGYLSHSDIHIPRLRYVGLVLYVRFFITTFFIADFIHPFFVMRVCGPL